MDDMCETDGASKSVRQRKASISYDRRKQLYHQSMTIADQLVGSGLEPHEMTFLLGCINELLYKER